MSHKSDHLNTILDKINADGGCFLPAIQRKFVWSDKKIVALFDSVMRGYPIGSLLIWKTKQKLSQRKFTEIFTKDIDPRTLFTPADEKEKHLVLDGQQRLQALLIGTRGTYLGKVLCFDILAKTSDPKLTNSDPPLKYKFEFISPVSDRFEHRITVKEMMGYTNAYKLKKFCQKKLGESGVIPTPAELEQIEEYTAAFVQYFASDQLINYVLIDAVVDKDKFTESDIVEIFVRTNNGGTKLEKSELLFALLSSDWDAAVFKINELREDLKKNKFEFQQDFILKFCLMIFGKKAAYKVEKFRDPEMLRNIQDDWAKIAGAVTNIVDFMPAYTPIDDIKLFTYKNSALPLMYFAYKWPKKWETEKNKQQAALFISKIATSSVFSGSKDTLLDLLCDELNKDQDLDAAKLLSLCEQQTGKSIKFTEAQLLANSYKKKSKVLFLMQAMFTGLDFRPSNPQNRRDIDHLVPQSILKKIGVEKRDIDQFANLAALTAQENSAEKKARPLHEYLEIIENKSKGAKKVFMESHLIPEPPKEWTKDSYAIFIEERKKLLLTKARSVEIIDLQESDKDQPEFATEEDEDEDALD